ncbi:MAG: DsbA family oxidoreductase [Sinobacteraceae bacterium]|nr:DsbA family oxidoreductase [Nevskiaceae bacterium]MCP5470782.1 DsbA family oxidoreductase [Nevskiaceae bacterium]
MSRLEPRYPSGYYPGLWPAHHSRERLRPHMKIEVYSDTICPWCYVGFARLQEALAARPGIPMQIGWLPFELNPDLPPEGEDRRQYMLRRFGDVDRFAAGQAQLLEIGATLGLDFEFGRITRTPNTRRSHALIHWAGEAGAATQTDVKRRALRAHFSEGRDLADPQVLAGIAAAAGLDREAALIAIDEPARHKAIMALEAQARQWGVSGVPTFIFERRYAFSGAQSLEVFLGAIDQVASELAGQAGSGPGAVAGATSAS